MPATKAVEKLDVVRRIMEAQSEVLVRADDLVNEYTRKDKGYGTGVGMRAAEDALIRSVESWRKVCGGHA